MEQEIDYVIIGAGMAGLSAGYQLLKQNKNFIILEKESSAGGRASTKKVEGLNFDLGAAFIMGSYKELFKIVKDLNIKVIEKPNYASRIGIVYKGNIHVLNSNLVSLFKFDLISVSSKIKSIMALPWLAKDFIESSFFNNSIKDKNLREYFNKSLGKDYVKYLIDPLTNNLFFYNTNSLSKLLFYKLVNDVKADTTYYNFTDGINEVGNKLAAELPLEFKATTVLVERKSKKIEVSYSKNDQIVKLIANKVIIAVPGNQVLNIVKHPTVKEKSFLEKVHYSSTIKVLCSTKEEIFTKFDRIFFVEHKNQILTSINFVEKINEDYFFTVGLNSELSETLINKGNFTEAFINKLIKQNLEFITEFKIHDISKWKSALPKFSKSYVHSLKKFLVEQSINPNGISYAGDYLYGPFIEGAVNSGINAVNNLR